MNPKQAAFTREYCVDYNATQAAIRAGYSPKTAAEQGYDLLRKPQIAAEVKRLSNVAAEELGITKRWILQQLKDSVETNFPRYVESETDKGDVVLTFGNAAAANKALELLMKHAGLLTEKVEHSGGIDIRINGVDVDQLR